MTENQILACYAGLSAAICAMVAMVELLHRYSHAAKAKVILLNAPAGIYLGINFAVGLLAVLGAHSSGVLVFPIDVQGINIPGLFKAFGAGLIALTILRSSLATFRGGDDAEINVGLVTFLNKINEMLERKINLIQKVAVEKEISRIMENVDPVKARYELPALCLTGIRSCTEEDVKAMQDAISKIMDSKAVLVRPILIGYALYDFCGLEVLESAVKRLGGDIQSDDKSKAMLDDMNVSKELAEELKRLKEKV